MTGTHHYFSVRTVDGVNVVEFSRTDVVDGAYIERLGDELHDFVKPIEQPRIVVDFAKVTHLSSAALGMLVALDKLIRRNKGGLRIANVSKELFKIFRMTKLHKAVEIHPSTDAAIASLK